MKKLLKYKHALLLLYFPFYLMAFNYLETVMPQKIHIIEFSLDHLIPFNEYFVIPYLLWFPYMGLAGIYFLFKDKESFVKMMLVGMIGMTTFIVVSYLYPNGLSIRPTVFYNDNICTRLVKMLYHTDPARNVFPSIHVYNSMAIAIIVKKSKSLKDNWIAQDGSLILTFLIVLATMFIKQHSIFDVCSAILLVSLAVEIVYNEHISAFILGKPVYSTAHKISR